ncbi:MAG: hypothetical protein F6K61_09620 [Sphaerospermopsis sp. SIO1G1]|nr:hypothetical protein [Sphaerospermopsis sp. SIO1G1]
MLTLTLPHLKSELLAAALRYRPPTSPKKRSHLPHHQKAIANHFQTI